MKQLMTEVNFDSFIHERPHLFSQTAIYISPEDREEILKLIKSVESVIASEDFQSEVLNFSPAVSHQNFGPHGVFMGYDFHLTENGPKLIEINTNAGGGYLNLVLARAQLACCEGVKPACDLDRLDADFVSMFKTEWLTQKGELPLRTIAIIDSEPEKQYLYPEFKLFESLFKKHGMECFILDQKDLELRGAELWFENTRIDLIYNRSTDFQFEMEVSAQIKQSYLAGGVVVTPNPHHHAIFANKLNLEILSNTDHLKKLNVASDDIEVLSKGVPKSFKLTKENREDFWKKRRQYFFKPSAGYGSKAAYRGDKITLKVWEEISHSNYIAQEIVQPGMRVVQVGEVQSELKLDLRAYTYQGQLQLLASRLYTGQTTNFRTQGGGFAPVFML